jgi:hypothetical protein
MRKIFVLCGLLGIMLAFFSTSSCKPEDTIAPVIFLKGANPDTIFLPASPGTAVYADPGDSAHDNKDGILTNQVKVFGTVNPNVKGLYTITFSVKDAAGNVATVNRIVQVINQAEPLTGSYTVTDSIPGSFALPPYAQTIITDSYTNNMIHFNKFGNYYNDSTVYAIVSGLNGMNMTLPSQTSVLIANNQTHLFQGLGSDSTGALVAKSIHLTYTDKNKDSVNTVTHITVWRP